MEPLALFFLFGYLVEVAFALVPLRRDSGQIIQRRKVLMNPIAPTIEAGVDTGLIRAFRALPGFRVENLEAVRADLRARVIPVIGRYSPDRAWGPRGQFTYSELFAMGAAARMHYQDAPMSVEVATDVLGPLTRFLNSWLHE
jgi:hypothetical protein